MPQVVDAFMFLNELDLLRVRINYLKDYVDRFVLIECTRNHNDQPVEPLFNSIRHEFEGVAINHIILDDLPRGGSNWDRVIYHRNAMEFGVENMPDDTVVMTSDMDEIPHIETLKAALTSDHWFYRGIRDDGETPMIGTFLQKLYYYHPEFRCSEQDGYVWEGTRICTKAMLTEHTAHGIRHVAPALIPYKKQLPKGGWHFSYFGDAKFIQNKVLSIAETHDMVKMADMSVEAIDARVRANRDLYERPGEHWGTFPMEADMPPGMEKFLWR